MICLCYYWYVMQVDYKGIVNIDNQFEAMAICVIVVSSTVLLVCCLQHVCHALYCRIHHMQTCIACFVICCVIIRFEGRVNLFESVYFCTLVLSVYACMVTTGKP